MTVLNAQAATEYESEDPRGHISHETAICRNLQFHKGDRKKLDRPLQTNTYACCVFTKKSGKAGFFLVWSQHFDRGCVCDPTVY
jgi:hypothetical protein